MLFFKTYRLNQSLHILQTSYRSYLKNKNSLSEDKREAFKKLLLDLQESINRKDQKEADRKAKEVESFKKAYIKKSWFFWGIEVIFALAVALVAATVIRQMWFELYEIPTGSMRPTFKEQDHLTVSKTQFGINVPLQTDHFYFDPNLVQRTSALIFSGDGLPLIDTDTTFLGIFPYKKRYIKRLAAKPEDQLVFYGGKIYLLNSQGELEKDFLEAPWMKTIENIPFIGFEGQPQKTGRQEIIFNYFNIPFGKVSFNTNGNLEGEIFNGKKWVKDDLKSAKQPHNEIKSLSDLFGMKNFAMAQIYTKEELDNEKIKSPLEGMLYLVLRHTPHLDYKMTSKANRLPNTLTTVIPLQENDLKQLMSNLYTSRFDVLNGKVRRYSLEPHPYHSSSPKLNIPDGTYEFYFGKAYEVLFGGITKELPESHPIYAFSPKRVQEFFNLGINWDLANQPKENSVWPNRYAYFREGDLYVMGGILFKKDDPRLQAFIEQEKEKEEKSSGKNIYIAFIDRGPPDIEQIKNFGLKVPKKNYLALGDNHAMSGDSRMFGFVPENNLQGVPEVILWPLGDRIGHPEQKPYPTFVFPRIIIWILAAIGGLVSYAIYWYRLNRPIKL